MVEPYACMGHVEFHRTLRQRRHAVTTELIRIDTFNSPLGGRVSGSAMS
jgi:hypothetical protein